MDFVVYKRIKVPCVTDQFDFTMDDTIGLSLHTSWYYAGG